MPEFVGSGILLEVGAARFLISAAHVFDSDRPKTRFVPVEGELIQIRGKGRVTTPPKGDRSNDQNDCVFINLEEPLISRIEKSNLFLSVRSVEMNDVSTEDDFYLFSGFPSPLEKRTDESVSLSRSCLVSQLRTPAKTNIAY
jgi:hypothetical protein